MKHDKARAAAILARFRRGFYLRTKVPRQRRLPNVAAVAIATHEAVAAVGSMPLRALSETGFV
ncbi:hypothetical protein MESS2_730193 [Mesorhizobium metallidurans STM 2683]|uniref:Uncharacterized protein n=1 Tax=Mesorhizobium metallidurans STM 2683 TaxID=1297569 RepID=M5EVQ2_9HYPH|nr:hypothetical protein MESS2_730193 [Mesorhizobium metallidurans STM 2683]